MMLEQWQKEIIESKIRHPVFALEWLTPDEQVIEESIVDVVNGNINFDANNHNRRSANITLKNLDKRYIPSSNSKLWLNNKIRFKAGYKYDNDKYLWFDQGIYVLGNPNILSSSSQKEVSLQLNDKWLLLNGEISGKLQNKYVIPVDTSIDEVVKSIIFDLTAETKYIIEPINELTPYTIEKPAGSTIADLLIELAELYSCEVFYNNQGYLVFRKALQPKDIELTPYTWSYKTEGLYLQSNRELDWTNIRNSITVYGIYNEDTGEQYMATSTDYSGSELSVDKIGLRPDVIELNLWSNDLCQQRADYELFNRIKAQEHVRLDIIPNYSHSLEDVIQITDEFNGCEGNYLIQQISYNISHDSIMQIGAWKVRSLS